MRHLILSEYSLQRKKPGLDPWYSSSRPLSHLVFTFSYSWIPQVSASALLRRDETGGGFLLLSFLSFSTLLLNTPTPSLSSFLHFVFITITDIKCSGFLEIEMRVCILVCFPVFMINMMTKGDWGGKGLFQSIFKWGLSWNSRQELKEESLQAHCPLACSQPQLQLRFLCIPDLPA